MTSSTEQLLETALLALVALEASAGVSGQPVSVHELPPGASLTAKEQHVASRRGGVLVAHC